MGLYIKLWIHDTCSVIVNHTQYGTVVKRQSVRLLNESDGQSIERTLVHIHLLTIILELGQFC